MMRIELSHALMNWHVKQNTRDLPWKQEKDPYKIWLSEVILQQTQVIQGVQYYSKFLDQFPDIHALADASEADVLHCWQGLGYYSRGRNLKKAAEIISKDLNGVFPQDKAKLMELPGVGDYIASAVSSFAFNEPNVVLDANVYRVLARWYQIETPIQTPKAHKEFSALAKMHLGAYSAADFNQAIMDFGATVCTPKKPLCLTCPMEQYCLSAGEASKLYPRKIEKKAKKHLQIACLWIEKGDSIALIQRPDTGTWANMYSLPSAEVKTNNTSELAHSFHGLETDLLTEIANESQVLTHQKISAILFHYSGDLESNDFQWIKKSELLKLAYPKFILDFLTKYTLL